MLVSKWRRLLSAKKDEPQLKAAALAKGYDSNVLMTPKAFSEFRAGIKLPRSMELNVLNEDKAPNGGRMLRGSV
jgi:hypothetical protein